MVILPRFGFIALFFLSIPMAATAQVATFFQVPLDTAWKETCPSTGDGGISQGFGRTEDDPLCNRDSGWYGKYHGYHLAYDVLIEYAQNDINKKNFRKVLAPANGTIGWAGHILTVGYVVVIEHELPLNDPDGKYVCSVFYHMLLPKDGGVTLQRQQRVSIGDTIGFVSPYPSDHGSVPHQHFGIRKGPFKGDPAVKDVRTGKWFYVGYTTIYKNAVATNDPTDPLHAAIISEWYNPYEFLKRHRPSTQLTTLTISTATCPPGTSCSGHQGTTFSFAGSGFTPGGAVRRYIVDSSGTQTELLPALSADANGGISWEFFSLCSTSVDTYRIFARDSEGHQSNDVTEGVVAASYCVPGGQPTLIISSSTCAPGSNCSGMQGTTFHFLGTGFTPGWTVKRIVTGPFTWQELQPLMSADANGWISWSYTTSCADWVGPYSVYAEDNYLRVPSNPVAEQVTSAGCFVQLTNTTGRSFESPMTLAISADGSAIAFSSLADLEQQNPDHYNVLYVMDTTTGRSKRLAADLPLEYLSLSPLFLNADGSRVVFTAPPWSPVSYAVYKDDTGRIELPFPAALVSSDLSTGIIATFEGNVRIYAINFDGTNKRLLAEECCQYSGMLAPMGISGDGSRLLFAFTRRLNTPPTDDVVDWRLGLINTADGSGLSLIQTFIGPGVISENGSKAAYSAGIVYSADSDGGNVRSLGVQGDSVQITGDGSEIMYLYSNMQLFMIKSDGTGLPRPVSPGCYSMIYPRMSADGKRIIFRSNCDFTGENPDRNDELFLLKVP